MGEVTIQQRVISEVTRVDGEVLQIVTHPTKQKKVTVCGQGGLFLVGIGGSPWEPRLVFRDLSGVPRMVQRGKYLKRVYPLRTAYAFMRVEDAELVAREYEIAT